MIQGRSLVIQGLPQSQNKDTCSLVATVLLGFAGASLPLGGACAALTGAAAVTLHVSARVRCGKGNTRYLVRVRGIHAGVAVALSLGAGTSGPRGPAGAEHGQVGTAEDTLSRTYPQLLWHVQSAGVVMVVVE